MNIQHQHPDINNSIKMLSDIGESETDKFHFAKEEEEQQDNNNHIIVNSDDL